MCIVLVFLLLFLDSYLNARSERIQQIFQFELTFDRIRTRIDIKMCCFDNNENRDNSSKVYKHL